MGAGFAAADRFVAEVQLETILRAGYVLLGDEIFLYERCRRAVLETFVPRELRDFCLSDLDLAETSIFEVLDRARTPSLMAPFQVFFVRRSESSLYARREEGRVRRDRRIFPLAESAEPDSVHRRPYSHSVRSAPHGHGRQKPLRADSRDAWRLVRHGGAGARG